MRTALLLVLATAPPDEGGGPIPPAPRVATAQDPDPSSARLEDATRLAIERGLTFLATEQAKTVGGGFPRDGGEYAPIGVTALGALAYMAAGNVPGRGPHGKELMRALDYLLEKTDLGPSSRTRGFVRSGDAFVNGRMHAHGFATLALAEAYGMAPQRLERVGEALEAAVRLIERSQGAEGGWQYQPFAVAQHEGSVTIALVQALRAARNSGVTIDTDVVRRAEDYVVRLQKDDGTFRYQLDDESSTTALTAAAITTLNMAGRYDDRVITSAIDAVWSGLLLQEEENAPLQWPYYQRLYVAQAFWQLSDTSHFERWYASEREVLLKTQNDDGSWSNGTWGDCYATAVNCLVLALPQGLLPVFQR